MRWRPGRSLRLRFRIVSLLRWSCHVLGYVYHTDAHLFLSYYGRKRECDVDDGKDKKGSSDYLVPSHFRGLEVEWLR
jgi:hypothetical protein